MPNNIGIYEGNSRAANIVIWWHFQLKWSPTIILTNAQGVLVTKERENILFSVSEIFNFQSKRFLNKDQANPSSIFFYSILYPYTKQAGSENS